MIDFTSFGKLIPDSVQLHYSLSRASLQLPYSLNSYRSLYPQKQHGDRFRRDELRCALGDVLLLLPHGLPDLPTVGDVCDLYPDPADGSRHRNGRHAHLLQANGAFVRRAENELGVCRNHVRDVSVALLGFFHQKVFRHAWCSGRCEENKEGGVKDEDYDLGSMPSLDVEKI